MRNRRESDRKRERERGVEGYTVKEWIKSCAGGILRERDEI